MIRLGRGSAERTLILIGVFLIVLLNFVLLRSYSSSPIQTLPTDNTPFAEDYFLHVEINEKGEILLRYPTQSNDAKVIGNLIELKSHLDFGLEKRLNGGGRPFVKAFIQFNSNQNTVFYARLLRIVERLVRDEISFESKKLEDRNKMSTALDLFFESERTWNTFSLSRNEKERDSFGFSLFPIAEWRSKEMEAIRWIQSIQFPENCREQETLRYSGYESQSIVEALYAETWPFIHSLSLEKTLVSTFEENLQAKECSKSSLECYFLPFTSCLSKKEDESKMMKGFTSFPKWDAEILKDKFPTQSRSWIFTQIIRFLARPSKGLRKSIDDIKSAMRDAEFIPSSFEKLKNEPSCAIVYVDRKGGEDELTSFVDQAYKKGKKRIFLISEDLKLVKNPPNGGSIQYFQIPTEKAPYTPREKALYFLAYSFAATDVCDAAYVSTSNYGRFIQQLLAIRTNDKIHYDNMDSLGEATLERQDSDFTVSTTESTPNIPKTIDTSIQSGPTKQWFNRTKVATIIEERPQPHLIPVIAHFMQMVPPDWPFIVWHSPSNIEMLKKSNLIRREIKSGRLELRLLPSDVSLRDGESMSRFLTKPWFWEQFEAEYILFFQTDSMFCAQSDQSVEDYVGYDYVGAPWPFYPEVTGGNGGLSMRRKSAILTVLANVSRPDNGKPEDLWYSIQLAPKGNLPPNEKAAKFSVENPFLPSPQRPLGFHRGGIIPQEWKVPHLFQDYQTYCPEVRMFHDPPR